MTLQNYSLKYIGFVTDVNNICSFREYNVKNFLDAIFIFLKGLVQRDRERERERPLIDILLLI